MLSALRPAASRRPGLSRNWTPAFVVRAIPTSVRLYRMRNRDQQPQTLRYAAHSKSNTNHSNGPRIVSNRNWSRSAAYINEGRDSADDHYET
jgi:hypothetical protein